MSIALKTRVYRALQLNPTQQATADLIDWQSLTATASMSCAARYFPHLGITQVNQRYFDELLGDGREAEILAILLHELAHQFVGKINGEWEAHNAIFAGICWGLQRRAGVVSHDSDYDIQDEPESNSAAYRMAGAITHAEDISAALRLIDGYLHIQRDANSIQAIGRLPKILAVGAGIPVIGLVLSGHGGMLLNFFFH
jgi:hypothetical protein